MSSLNSSLPSQHSVASVTVSSVPTLGNVQTVGQPQESLYTDVLPMVVFMVVMWTITLRQLRTP